MNNEWENSWHDTKVVKQTIEQLDISTATKETLLKHLDILPGYHEAPVDMIDFLNSVGAYYGSVFMFELFAHFVKNGTIELQYFKENNN